MKWLPISLSAERRTALFASSFLFCILTAFILLKSARDAFFLSAYSSRMLPYAMTVNTIVSGLAALLFLRLYRYFSLARLLRFTFSIFIGGTILLWDALAVHVPRFAGILYLWVGIFGTIAPVQAWALIAMKFSTRQAKRVMGIVGGGAIFGAMAGGVLARLIARSHAVPWLLPFAAFFVLLGLLFSLSLSPGAQIERVPATTSLETPRNYRRLIILLLLIVSIGTVVSSFVDFEFKTVAQRRLSTAAGLAVFFGSFYAYLGAATLLFQLIGTPVLMRRLGIAATLSLLPLSLFIGNALVLVIGLFASTLLMRGSEEVLRYSVDRSSLEVLYVAIPEQAKVRLKSAIDTIGVRVPEGVASLCLIALFSVGKSSVHFLFVVNAILLLCWLGCVIFLGKVEYPRLLKQEIQRKELDLESIKRDLFDLNFYRLLPQIFQNGEKQTVLDLLELLETSGKRWIGRYLAVALNRDENEIRMKALKMLFNQDGNLAADVRPFTGQRDPAIRTEAIHYLCFRSKVSLHDLESWRNDRELAVRAATCAAFCRERGQRAAGYRMLEELRREALERGNQDARIEICHVLAFVSPSEASTPIYHELLRDSSLEVRRAALTSIAISRPSGIVPDLLRSIRIPAIAPQVRSALAAYGQILLPHFTKILEDPRQRIQSKKVALQVAADIGAARALPVILKAARQRNLTVRFEAIKTLNRLNKRLPLFRVKRETINKLLAAEIQDSKREFRRMAAFGMRPDGLLLNVLRQRYAWSAARIYRLIGLVHDQSAIYYAYLAWNSNDSRLRDAALDYLEHQIDSKWKNALLPILEAMPLPVVPKNEENRKTAAFEWLKQKDRLLTAALIADLSDEEFTLWQNEIQKTLRRHEHPLINEILQRRKRKMDTHENAKQNHGLSTIEKMESLAKIDIFSHLGSHELLLLADQAIEVMFAAGDIIFSEGQIAKDAFCLLDGEVSLNRSSKNVNSVSPGESFGMLELLSNQTHLFSAIAAKDCVCLKIEREIFWEILEDYPTVARSILEVLVDRIRSLTDKVSESMSV